MRAFGYLISGFAWILRGLGGLAHFIFVVVRFEFAIAIVALVLAGLLVRAIARRVQAQRAEP